VCQQPVVVAVLVSPDDLESLEETLAILSDPAAMVEIREIWMQPFAGGRGLRGATCGCASRTA
jgi:PHD/YefM family antitoxin component YafN of YafNO toxin-antitoxin module